ncbi:hypothetical protein IT418_03985 [bacterium]|nr:hypothetical protein [bacterium]
MAEIHYKRTFRNDLYDRKNAKNPHEDYFDCLESLYNCDTKDVATRNRIMAIASAIADSMSEKELALVLGALLDSRYAINEFDMEFFLKSISGVCRFSDTANAGIIKLYKDLEPEFLVSSPEKTMQRLKKISEASGRELKSDVLDKIHINLRTTILGEEESKILLEDKVVPVKTKSSDRGGEFESW